MIIQRKVVQFGGAGEGNEKEGVAVISTYFWYFNLISIVFLKSIVITTPYIDYHHLTCLNCV